MFFVLFFSTTLFASIANITAIRGDAFIQDDAGKRVAKLGAALEKKDSIVTKANAKVQLIFKDETIVTVGKDSVFSIKDYAFDEKEPVVRFSILKGAMRTNR